MTVAEIGITGYRSIRNLRLPLRQLTVLVGANGVGKTNLYRSLELLHAAATGTLADDIARDGGLGSIFWAGGSNLTEDRSFNPMFRTDGFRRHEGNRLKLEVALQDLAGPNDGVAARYAIELGFPDKKVGAAFPTEAQVKAETLSIGTGRKPVVLLERENAAMMVRDAEGRRSEADAVVLASETALSGLRGGHDTIETVRRELEQWRFYHGFATHADSPLRRPGRAVTSPMLASDGSNLAAVFATLRHIREETIDLDDAIDLAFPGAQLEVPMPDTEARFAMVFPETPKRPFLPHELSDGTLHFLALMGALHAYRLPPLIALNEPETSLHPDLLPSLGQAIARAARRSQVVVVTHSRDLADTIASETGSLPRQVIRREADGATWIEGLGQFGTFEDE